MNVSRDLLFIFVFVSPMLCSSSAVGPEVDPLQLIEEAVDTADLDPLQLNQEDDEARGGQTTPTYEKTANGQNAGDCPSGYAGIFNEAECKKAKDATNKRWGGAHSWWNIQKGCFTHSSGKVWFNKHTTGRDHGSFASVCVMQPGCPAGWPQIKAAGEEGTASSAITAESGADCAAKCAALSNCGSFKINTASLACSFNTWAQSPTMASAEESDTYTCKRVFAENSYGTACPSNLQYDVTEESDCKEAAAALGKKWHGASTWNNQPGGCSILAGNVIFNSDKGTASEGSSKFCSSSGFVLSTSPSNSNTTQTTTPSLTSICTPGVCTKGKWAFHLSGKTEEQCKATCEEGRKYVPIPDGIQEDVYFFKQNARFHDLTARMPSASRKVKEINYRSTGSPWKDPEGKEWKERDNYYVRWSGYIEIKAAGEYEFNTRSDDGSRLFINDNQVLENGGWHGMQDRRGKVQLSAGKHQISVEFFEGGSGAGIEWKYKGPDTGNSEIIVPERVLSSSLNGGPHLEFNPEWAAMGMCKAYSYDGSNCVIYSSCDELAAGEESVICEDNSFDWVEPSGLTTCKY